MTRERLLAVGSDHFSRLGYAATTIRGIATEAGANVAAISYHFGGKEDLFLATLEEPLKRIAEERAGLLAAAGDNLTVTAVANAFVRPLRHSTWPGGAVAFCRMLMRSFHEAPQLRERIWRSYFRQTRDRFISALQAAAPEASPQRIELAFHFLLSTVVGTISNAERMAPEVEPISAIDDNFLDDLIAFLAAGLARTLATRHMEER